MKFIAVCCLFLAIQCSATPLNSNRIKKEILTHNEDSFNALNYTDSKGTEANIQEKSVVKPLDLKNNTQSLNNNIKNGTNRYTTDKGANMKIVKSENIRTPKLEKLFENGTPLFHADEFKVRVLDIDNPTQVKNQHPLQVSIGSALHQGIYIPASLPKIEPITLSDGFLAKEHHFSSLNFHPYNHPDVSVPFDHFYDVPSLPVSYPVSGFSEAYPVIYPIELPQHTEYPVFGGEHQIIPVISDINQLPPATILNFGENFAAAGEHVDDQVDSVSVEAVEPLSKNANPKKEDKKDNMLNMSGLNKTKDAEVVKEKKGN